MKKQLKINRQLVEFEQLYNRDGEVSFIYNEKKYIFSKKAETSHSIVISNGGEKFFTAFSAEHLLVDGVDVSITLPTATRKMSTKSSGSNNMLSPMPGKILKVLVKVGDEVQLGDPLIVMEAMKMEHTIKAIGAGVVTSVHYFAGELVDGQVDLLDIQELEQPAAAEKTDKEKEC